MNERNSIFEDMVEEEMYSPVTHSFTSKKKKSTKYPDSMKRNWQITGKRGRKTNPGKKKSQNIFNKAIIEYFPNLNRGAHQGIGSIQNTQ